MHVRTQNKSISFDVLFMNPNTAVCTTNHVKYNEQVFFSSAVFTFSYLFAFFEENVKNKSSLATGKSNKLDESSEAFNPTTDVSHVLQHW